MRARRLLLGWIVLAIHPGALAQDYGNYLDISFTGDGETPSNLERLGKNIQRSAQSLQSTRFRRQSIMPTVTLRGWS